MSEMTKQIKQAQEKLEAKMRAQSEQVVARHVKPSLGGVFLRGAAFGQIAAFILGNAFFVADHAMAGDWTGSEFTTPMNGIKTNTKQTKEKISAGIENFFNFL